MKPTRSLAIITAAGVLAAAAASGWLASQAEGRVRAEVAAARDGYLVKNLRTVAESNVSIGLTLDQMDSLQALIERERESADNVLSIDVFNGSGIVVYSTDRSAIGTSVAAPWVPYLDREGTWAIAGRGERVVGTRFDNDLGRAEGGIALTLRTAEAAERANPIARLQALGAPLLATLVALVLAGAIAAAVLGNRLTRFRRAGALMAPDAPAAAPPGDPLAALAASERERWVRLRKAIAEREAGLRRLDDAA